METIKPKNNLRYTAFIDILGFKDAVNKTEDSSEIYKRIILVLTNLADMKGLIPSLFRLDHTVNQHDKTLREIDLNIQVFSDSILISANDSDYGLKGVVAFSTLSYWLLFTHGFFARGAITKGELLHTDKIAFGESLIRAYELEQKAAIYPRIIILEEIQEEERFRSGILPAEIDHDGTVFLNIFHAHAGQICDRWNDIHPKENYIIHNNGIRELMQQLTAENRLNVRQKLIWLKNHLNKKQPILHL